MVTKQALSRSSHLSKDLRKRKHRLVQHVERQREELLLRQKRDDDRYLQIGTDLPFALAADDGLAGYFPIGILQKSP